MSGASPENYIALRVPIAPNGPDTAQTIGAKQSVPTKAMKLARLYANKVERRRERRATVCTKAT